MASSSTPGSAPVLSVRELGLRTEDGNFSLNVESVLVDQGDTVAVLGANGSGKTTFLEAILGLRGLESGGASFWGESCDLFFRGRKSQRIGVQLQKSTYSEGYTVSEVVMLHRAIYGKDSSELQQLLKLKEIAPVKYGSLSRGQKQRVDLYVCFAHEPELAVLDEPATGLDVSLAAIFMDYLAARVRKKDLTLLMASHTSREVDLASHILWLENGQLAFFGSKQALISERLGQARITLEPMTECLAACSDWASTQAEVTHTHVDPAGKLVVYGTSQIRVLLEPLVERSGSDAFSFHSITTDDLLALVATERGS